MRQIRTKKSGMYNSINTVPVYKQLINTNTLFLDTLLSLALQ